MRVPGGGGLLPGCGVSGVGSSPTPNHSSFRACRQGPLPTGCGCGGCGRGDPSPTPQRPLLRAGFARCGNGNNCTNGKPPSAPPPPVPNVSPTAHTGLTVTQCIAYVTLAIGTTDDDTAHSTPGNTLRRDSTSGATNRHTTCNTHINIATTHDITRSALTIDVTGSTLTAGITSRATTHCTTYSDHRSRRPPQRPPRHL